MKNLCENPDILIQKSDKGNSVAILNKKVYLEKINKMPDKTKQFLRLPIQEEEKIQFFD